MGAPVLAYTQRRADASPLWALVCYLHKPVLSLGRMEYRSGALRVIYHGKNEAAPGRGTVAYDPMEFMALLLAHVLEPHEIRVRYYGAASSTIRCAKAHSGRDRRRRTTRDVAAGDAVGEESGPEELHCVPLVGSSADDVGNVLRELGRYE